MADRWPHSARALERGGDGPHNDVCSTNVIADEGSLAEERARLQRVDHLTVLANAHLALADDEEFVSLVPL
jgi:hypothetical protein